MTGTSFRWARYLHLNDRNRRLARYLFQRYGGRVVFFARFIAFLRALAGLLAGANGMPLNRFVLFSGLGALAWSATVGSAAYVLGQRMEALSMRANLVIATFVLLAALAGLRFLTRNRARLQIDADRSGG